MRRGAVARRARSNTVARKRAAVRAVLESEYGNVTRAAAQLGICRQSFWEQLRRLDMGRVPAEIRARIARTFVVE